MFLSQALTKVKNLKSKLSRIDKIISKITVEYEDADTDYVYLDEIANRKKLIEEINQLKVRVQATNIQTNVVWQGETILLAKLILNNADLRSELAFLQTQLDVQLEPESEWRRTVRSKDDVKKVFTTGYSKTDIRVQLDKTEILKEQIDGLMNSVNASTTLV